MAVDVIHGDCIAEMRRMAAEGVRVQAVVTDPPSGIGFMNRAWDGDKGGRDHWIAWMREVAAAALALVPPGGHALVWALPRTSHWTATAWEDAGWEVRDRLAHIFGTGFPKSLNVSAAIDREAGAVREVVGINPNHRPVSGVGYEGVYAGGNTGAPTITAPATEAAKQWAGWGTALKPAIEDWWLFRRPLDGTVAANVLAHGTGGLNIDACRVAYANDADFESAKGGDTGSAARSMDGWGLKQAIPQSAKITPSGRWPSNVVTSGDAEVEAAFAVFGEKSSHDAKGTWRKGVDGACYGHYGATEPVREGRGDTGSASRFFAKCPPTEDELRLFYSAKADEHDRAGSRHPTVKPVSLMRWLVRLVTPPGGTVLDCFAGSGTTLEAAMLEGFNAIGIEQDAEHHADCLRRIASVQPEALDPASMLASNVAERFAQVPRRAPISELPLFAAVAAE